MSCLSGTLRKTVHSPLADIAALPVCVWSVSCLHAHMYNREEKAVMLSSDIYLSNPISSNPYLPSQPPVLLQQQPVLLHLSK